MGCPQTAADTQRQDDRRAGSRLGQADRVPPVSSRRQQAGSPKRVPPAERDATPTTR